MQRPPCRRSEYLAVRCGRQGALELLAEARLSSILDHAAARILVTIRSIAAIVARCRGAARYPSPRAQSDRRRASYMPRNSVASRMPASARTAARWSGGTKAGATGRPSTTAKAAATSLALQFSGPLSSTTRCRSSFRTEGSQRRARHRGCSPSGCRGRGQERSATCLPPRRCPRPRSRSRQSILPAGRPRSAPHRRAEPRAGSGSRRPRFRRHAARRSTTGPLPWAGPRAGAFGKCFADLFGARMRIARYRGRIEQERP